MEAIVLFVCSIIAAVYSALLMFCYWSWNKRIVRFYEVNADIDYRSVSLIIPFRNEDKNINQLVSSLSELSYPSLEIVLVNDHSTDDSLLELDRCKSPKIKVLNLIGSKDGKKAALEYGVQHSTGELLLFSDADCVFDPLWVESMVSTLENGKLDWLAGAIRFRYKKSISNYFQIFESGYLLMFTAFSIHLNKPTTCNGANVMMKRSLFLDLNGFEGLTSTPSGDDELFMQKAFRSGAKLGYCYKANSFVTTQAENGFKKIVQQRTRWGSKLKHNLLPYNFWLAILVFCFHVIGFFLMAYNPVYFVFFVLLRFLVELIGGLLTSKSFNYQFSLYYFTISFFVYPLYTIFMAVATQFQGFSWKGRNY